MDILICGAGAIGTRLASKIDGSEDMNLVGVVDTLKGQKLEDYSKANVDGVIDFSHPSNLEMVLTFAKLKNVATLIATTGFNNDDIKVIEEASKDAPIIFTRNTSLGINLMSGIVSQITKSLGMDFDIEVIEKHHNKKIDSPSGTAKLLIDSINSGKEVDGESIYGREGLKKREHGEIGVHSIRGGTIVGEHSVIYAGEDEIIEIKHEAHSKNVFVQGAIRGITWLNGKENGMYTMANVLGL